ncbi:hypothetical protein CHITON_0229 [Thermococcus chitonophagus]|uniref:Uncharacterized protein n=1 Tax=Thermococcus chitonophagus TaxID=54262 RepID=A0A170SBA4_9EURY|nr:hypothetical protein CHITON_0229 [Thermococcus chitonophagus]
MILVSVAVFVVLLICKFIPLLYPGLRFKPLAVLYLISGYATALAVSITPSPYLVAYGMILGIVSTFRSIIALIFLACIYRRKYISWKTIFIAIVAVLIISLARGLNLHDIILRPAFTYQVYERLYEIGMPFGKLFILPEPIPGYKVAALYGSKTRYTYTIFGEAVADFGVFGLFEAFVLGILVRTLRRLAWAHSFVLAVLTLSIELGLDAPKLAVIFLFGFITGNNIYNTFKLPLVKLRVSGSQNEHNESSRQH